MAKNEYPLLSNKEKKVFKSLFELPIPLYKAGFSIIVLSKSKYPQKLESDDSK